MDTATTTPRLLLVRSLLRPADRSATEGHLHFDRAARVWRQHGEREERAALVTSTSTLQECA